MKKQITAITLLFVVVMPISMFGQKVPNQKIDMVGKLELVDEFTDLLLKHYLYEDTARLMGKLLTDRLSTGEYDHIKMAREFSRALTKDLRANFRDRHIGISYNPKVSKAMQSGTIDNGGLTEEVIQEQLAIEIYENFRIPEVRRFKGNIGYLKIDQLLPPVYATGYSEKLAAAIELIADSDAIILDLRDNVGGYDGGVELLLSYFFEPGTHVSKVITRTPEGLRTVNSYTLENILGRRLLKQKVFALVSSSTGSGAEAIAHTLKFSNRGTLVGETTYGAGYLFNDFPVGEKFLAQIPYSTGMHPKAKANWESVGVKPNVVVPQLIALEKARELALKDLLVEEKAKPVNEQYSYKLKSLEWENNRRDDLKHAFELSMDQIQELIGSYGSREITAQGKNLFYQRRNPDRPIRRLIPVKPDEFLIEGLDEFRLTFTRVKKSNKIVALRFYSIDRLFIDGKE